MHTRLGYESAVHGEVTRRHVLQAGLAAGLGFGTMTLLETALSTRAAAAAPEYGGHLTILRAAHTDLWAGLGCVPMTLSETALSTRAAAAAPEYGGHLTILRAAYPEVWDPHRAAT